MNNRVKFFNLLRIYFADDPETLSFWDSLHSNFDQLRDLGVFDKSVGKSFLSKMFENEILASKIINFMKFNFKNDLDLVNYHVDFEFVN